MNLIKMRETEFIKISGEQVDPGRSDLGVFHTERAKFWTIVDGESNDTSKGRSLWFLAKKGRISVFGHAQSSGNDRNSIFHEESSPS